VPVQVLVAGAAVRLLSEDVEPSNALFAWQGKAWRLAGLGLQVRLVVEGHNYTVTLSSLPGKLNGWYASVSQGESSMFNGDVHLKLKPKLAASDAFDNVAPVVQLEMPGEPLCSLDFGWGERDDLFVVWERREYWLRTAPPLSTERLNTTVHLSGENTLESPMPGKVLKVLVSQGKEVVDEQPLVIIEAMKMEFTVRAPHAGRVAMIKYGEGEQVAVGDVLVELEK